METINSIFTSIKQSTCYNDTLFKLFNLLINERKLKDFYEYTPFDRINVYFKFIPKYDTIDEEYINSDDDPYLSERKRITSAHSSSLINVIIIDSNKKINIINKYLNYKLFTTINMQASLSFIINPIHNFRVYNSQFDCQRHINEPLFLTLYRDGRIIIKNYSDNDNLKGIMHFYHCDRISDYQFFLKELIDDHAQIALQSRIYNRSLYQCTDEFFLRSFIDMFYHLCEVSGYYYNGEFYKGNYYKYQYRRFSKKERIIPDSYKFVLAKNSYNGPYEQISHPDTFLMGDYWTYSNYVVNRLIDPSGPSCPEDHIPLNYEIMKKYMVVLFKPIKIVNVSQVPQPYSPLGSDLVKHNLAIFVNQSLGTEFSLVDLGTALYDLCSHKFDDFYEMWIGDIRFIEHENETEIQISFNYNNP